MGTIYAHDASQYGKWQRARKHRPPALSGVALEAAIMNIASLFPENVVRVTA